jgi:4-amino-4-deoxy-L-arabinose transferase-like glycosyltransferase
MIMKFGYFGGLQCYIRAIKNNSRLKRRVELLIVSCLFLTALLIRLKADWYSLTGEQGFAFGDDDDYYRLAMSLVRSGTIEDSGYLAYRMPVFPILLAVIYRLLGSSPHVAQPFILVLSGLTSVLIYFLGKLVFDARVGLLAGILAALDIGLIFYSKFLLTETLFVFLIVCSALSIEQLRRNPSWQGAIITGSFLGLSTLTRANFSILLPFFVGFIIYYSRPNPRIARRNVPIIILLVGALWFSWISRNFIELNALIPFTSQAGNAYFPIYNDEAASQRNAYLFGLWTDVRIPENIQDLDEVNKDKELSELAFTWIYENPIKALRIALFQPFHFWQPDVYGDISYLLLMMAGIIGFIRSCCKDRPSVILWALMIFALTFSTIFTIGIPRFRVALDPFIDILAALAFVSSGQSILLSFQMKRMHNQGTR